MSASSIGVLSLFILLLLIIVRVPVAISFMLVGFAGNVFLNGFSPAIAQLQLVIWEVANSFVLVALPLFIWMGQIASVGQLGNDICKGFQIWFGRVRGGLAVSSIFGSASFGAICGSSMATMMAMGQMLLPEMKRYKYDNSLAAGSVASAGVLAIMIPPSVPLVFYSAWTGTSLSALLIAAIIPGIFLTTLFAGWVLLRCITRPELAPMGQLHGLHEKIQALTLLLPTISVLVVVLGCIYAGVATPSEAAAIGVFGVLVICGIKGRLSLSKLSASLHHSAALSVNIFLLLLGGLLYSRFLTQTRLIQSLIDSIVTLGLPNWAIIILIVFIYLITGALLDTFSMIILTLPFVFPVILSLGYDPVWFGIFLVLMIELALITPPIGVHLLLLQRLMPDFELPVICRGILPFIVLTLLTTGVLIVFPEIALWLPSQLQ